jgi:hypothetical protein
VAKNVLLCVGYTKFLLPADEAAKAASILATAQVMDYEVTYSKICERNFTVRHYAQSADIRFDLAPGADEKIFANGAEARAEVKRLQGEAEVAKLAADHAEEERLHILHDVTSGGTVTLDEADRAFSESLDARIEDAARR